MINPKIKKTIKQIENEWNNIAELRFEQIKKGSDISLFFILIPCIIKLAKTSDYNSVIDVGCGNGFLTKKLAKKAKYLVGIDMSGKNIEIAKKDCSNISNVKLIKSTIDEYSKNIDGPIFTLGIANMTLMTTPNLRNILNSVSRLLKPQSQFIFTISHPCFWPFYWDYYSKKWFNYKKDICIETPFKISLDKTNKLITTHFHRPLEKYFFELDRAGFRVDCIVEPMPNEKIMEKYPKKWEYPRFLGIRCMKK
jgi:SAM-dependent methyltransferase